MPMLEKNRGVRKDDGRSRDPSRKLAVNSGNRRLAAGNDAPVQFAPINQGPCLPRGFTAADHARVTQVCRTRRRRLAFSLRAYFACGNMAARNEDFS
jgi:hypothetical protein